MGVNVTFSNQFCIGGVVVRLAGADRATVSLIPSLEPFRVEAKASDIQVQVIRAEKLPPARGRQIFDSGAIWRLHEHDAGFQFDFTAPVFGDQPYKRLLVDGDFRLATLEMSSERVEGSEYEASALGYPLDELLIMHRLTQEKAIELHGCGIVRGDGIGNLFVGHSGAGKSTTTRLWIAREDAEVLSDDRIIVRRDPSPSESNHLDQDDKKIQMRMYGTPWHGEAMYASPGSAPLARIFVLEHGKDNVLTRLTPSQAVAELFARAFVPFHRHEYVESALEFLQEVVQTVPCYRYAFEPNERAVERILELRD